jgi:outer membrane protein TolC
MRRLALQTEAVFEGQNPKDLPVNLSVDYPFVINLAIAELIGFSPDFAVLQKYKVINRDVVDPDKTISIAEVLDRVVSTNLGIRSAKLDYQSFSKEVGIARSQILPFLVASMEGIVVDPNLAEKTLGLNPQYQVSGYLNFSQLVYSELAFSQVRIQKTLRAAADFGYQEQVLDYILEGMEGYLNILRAKANLRIQESNKEITEINLSIAEQRLEVGYSGRSEVYRWESNLANANQEVVAARNKVNQFKVSLNASMNQPLDTEFDVAEANLSTYPFSKYSTESVYSLVHNQEGLQKGTEFMVYQAEKNLPTVSQIDKQVEAVEQRLEMYRRNRFLPEVSVSGNMTGRLYRGGAGWNPNDPQFFSPAKYFWTVGATASIPLFQGSLNNTRVQQSRIDLEYQENEKSLFLQDLEVAIRNQVYEVVIAKTNIDFTKAASDAASKALELTQDSYSEGTVSIVELIDAQNNALASELAYINSEYDFLIEVLRLERLTGSFLILRTEAENQQIINDYLQFQLEETNE